MKIAITGASGFLGKHVVAEALKNQHDVIAISRQSEQSFTQDVSQAFPHLSLEKLSLINCNLTDSSLMESNLTENKAFTQAIEGCDALIHLAAVMAGPEQYQQTLDINKQVLAAANSASIPRLVLASSLSVIDYRVHPALTRIDEGADLCRDDEALGDYARMKRDQELACIEWQQNTYKELAILRPGLIYSDDLLSDAHAGFIKKGFGLVALHEGEVPLVQVSKVAEALVNLCQQSLSKPCDIFHLIGSPAVKQQDYLLQLRRQGLLKLYLPLNWKWYTELMTAIRQTLEKSGKQDKIPDSLRSNSIAARQKPFHFASDKLSYLLASDNN